MATTALQSTERPTITLPAGVPADAWQHATHGAYAKAQDALPLAGERLTDAYALLEAGAVAYRGQFGTEDYTVTSQSDLTGQTTYAVHARQPQTCTCEDYGRHGHIKGFACKHIYAVWIYKRAMEQCEGQAEVRREVVPAPQTTSLPEAMFSITLDGHLGGRPVRLTARGQSWEEFEGNVARITEMLDAVPTKGQTLSAVSSSPPAPSAAEGSSSGLTFAAERLEGRVESGKEYWKIKGGRFGKFGVVAWPEVLAAAGFTNLDARQTYDLSGWIASYAVKEDGKPDKVTRLQRA
jgi:hypothetical protein